MYTLIVLLHLPVPCQAPNFPFYVINSPSKIYISNTLFKDIYTHTSKQYMLNSDYD